MRHDMSELTIPQIAGLVLFFVVMLLYVAAVSASQQRSFEEYHNSRPEMVYIQDTSGKVHAVPKADYDAANEKWRADHPEDYGFFDHMVECETPSDDGDVD